MTTRRIPSGQRPARRPGQPGRAGTRVTGRDLGARSDRGTTARYTRGSEAPRSATRPGGARRAAAGGATTRTSAPQPRRFTGRATALFAVFVALALAYTYPVRVYLGQQADIAQLEAAQAAQREHIGDLSHEAALWKDPAYIEIKARERFYMVRPGDRLVVVLVDPEGAARDAGVTAQTAPAPAEPWYDMLWSSVRAANEEGSAR